MGLARSLVHATNAILRPLGVRISRAQVEEHGSRMTMAGVLSNACGAGLNAATVFDVGVANGTHALYDAFPSARHVLIEPLAENEGALKKLVDELGHAEYILAAATHQEGSITINVHPDLDGSSIYLEHEDSDVNGVPRVVPTVTLDGVCNELDCKGPFVVKVDVQGAELDVLRGARRVLENTELVILEVVLYDFFDSGSRFFDIINFMDGAGFCVYDLMDFGYRPLDGAMSQVDIAFAPERGVLRQHHVFASRDQRDRLTAQLLDERAS